MQRGQTFRKIKGQLRTQAVPQCQPLGGGDSIFGRLATSRQSQSSRRCEDRSRRWWEVESLSTRRPVVRAIGPKEYSKVKRIIYVYISHGKVKE